MITRRTFLVASGLGLAGTAPAKPVDKHAKSTILFFLCGGASHIDTWDMKPDAPEEFRGPFKPIPTTAPGVRLCEHLPLTAQQAKHLAVVNSVRGTVNTNDHHAGYYHNLTGHEPDQSFRTLGNNRTPFPDDWPFMGSVVAAKRPPHPKLPSAITLPHKPSRAPYTRPGQFAARLGTIFDPMYVYGTREKPLAFQAPALTLTGDVTRTRLGDRRGLLTALDSARSEFDELSRHRRWDRQQERAFSLLGSAGATGAFDLSGEPEKLRERYGQTVNGMSLLVARRLVEVGVPFITVFWMEDQSIKSKCKSAGGWDTHGNNFNCLKDYLLPEFDRAYSALLSDLHDRGLLDKTATLVTSEMGRRPLIGDRRSGGVEGAGRDHWTHCLSALFAGGGIRGGQTYGSSDRRAEYPSDKPVKPAHVVKTVYKAMGIEDLEATDELGRPYHLLPEGEAIGELF